eukprot:26169_1
MATSTKRKKVMVSGCFDLLHSGHIKFLQEASKLGDLYVQLATDNTIQTLKHHKPMFPEQERLYMLRAIKFVHHAQLSTGCGLLDFELDIHIIKPDIFFVNQDGDKPSKRQLIQSCNIEYKVSTRTPPKNLKARSSTNLKITLKNTHKKSKKSKLICWGLYAILISMFCFFYYNQKPPLTNNEVLQSGICDRKPRYRYTNENLCDLLLTIEDNGKEFFMLIFIKSRNNTNNLYPLDLHTDKECYKSVWNAMLCYDKGYMPQLLKGFGHVLMMTYPSVKPFMISKDLDINGSMSEVEWDKFGIVRYRSKRDFLEMYLENFKEGDFDLYKETSVDRMVVYMASNVVSLLSVMLFVFWGSIIGVVYSILFWIVSKMCC